MNSPKYLARHTGKRAERRMKERWIKSLILWEENTATMAELGLPEGNCFYCDVLVYKKIKHRSKKAFPMATDDHVVPRSRGGYQSRLVDCCEDCNNAKAALTLEEYRVLLAFRYGYISGVEFKFPGEL